MAFAYFDRVKETSTTTGTGSITLAGAVSQFRSFQSVYATNDTMYYTIADQSGTNWEVGLGTLTGATILARSTVLASSNAGAAVNFTSGSLFVFTTIPAVALAFSPLGTLLFSNTSLPGGNTVANTAAETAFTSSYTIAANTMNQGDVFRIRLYGVYGTLVTPTTLEIKVKFGSTIMLDTGAFTDTGSLTNNGWMLEGYFIAQSIGATGAVETQGYSQFMTAATVGAAVPLTNTATKTIDTTASQAVTATAQWGSASASNTITLRMMTFEKMTTATGPVTNVTNSDGSLTISPTSGSVVASLNIANANSWTATQTFKNGLTIGIGPISLGSWIDMPTTGPSGIGTGGAGSNAWMAFCSAANQYFNGSLGSDVIQRNATGKRILVGIDNGSGTANPTAIYSGTTFSLPALSTTGVVHNNTSGTLSTSLIVDADITAATISRASLSAGAKDWIFLGSATGATTTVGPVIWTATVQQLMIYYWIAGYSGGTPVGRILLGSASISTTGLTNSYSLSEGVTSPTTASGAGAVPGCPLAVTLSAIGRGGVIFVDGASGSVKALEIIGRNVTPSVSSIPTLYRAASFFSDLSTNLNLLRAQLTVYDTLSSTAVSSNTFTSGTYLSVWGRNTD